MTPDLYVAIGLAVGCAFGLVMGFCFGLDSERGTRASDDHQV